MQKSMAVFILSVLDHKYSFWINCFQKYFDKKKKIKIWSKKKKKFKIVTLSWNLALRLIGICRYQWWRSFLVFSNENIVFFGDLFQKIKIVSWSWNLDPTLIPINRIRWWLWFLVQKLKIVCLTLSLPSERLQASFYDTLLVVSILDIVQDYDLKHFGRSRKG